MRTSALIVQAIAAVLSGAPSPVAAASTPAVPIFEPLVIAIGICGVAALALFAWFVLLDGRRRRGEANDSTMVDDPPATGGTTEEQVTAALHRRTLRRARVRLEEDPIIASMGMGSSLRAEPGVRRTRRSTRRSPPT